MRTALQIAGFVALVAFVTLAGLALDLPTRDYRGVSPGIDYKAR